MNKIITKLRKSTLLIKTIKLSVLSLFSNFLGFLIPIYIAFKYNISEETDSFFLSYTVILFISIIFSGAVRSVSIPYLHERLNEKKKLDEFVSSVYFFSFFFFLSLTIILSAFTFVIYLNTCNIFYWYLFISTPIILLTVINSFSYGILNSLGQFNAAEMSPFSRAIVIFFVIFLLIDSFGLSSVIIGYILGELVKFLHLYYIIVKVNKIKISFFNNKISSIKKFLIDGSSQILATILSASSPLIDRFVASFLLIGSISLLDYGDKLFLIFNVLLNAFLAILLSRWSSNILSKKFDLLEMNKIIIIVFIISVCLLMFIYLTKSSITNLLYPTVDVIKRGMIEMILVVNMIGFIFNSMSQILNRAMIVLKITNLMVITSAIKALINIILDIICAYYWGVLGIVYATVAVHLIGLITNYGLFYNRLKTIQI